MENVTAKMYPIVGGIKTKMIMNGAVNAVMSGSGPTVFGIFDDFEKAKKKSADSFAYQFKDVFLTQVFKLNEVIIFGERQGYYRSNH